MEKHGYKISVATRWMITALCFAMAVGRFADARDSVLHPPASLATVQVRGIVMNAVAKFSRQVANGDAAGKHFEQVRRMLLIK